MAVETGVAAVVDIAAPQQRVVLAVGDDQLVQPLGLKHGLMHETVALHAAAVVGKGGDKGRQRGHVRQRLSLLPHGNGPVGQDADAAVPGDQRQLRLQMLRRIGHRVQIRHGAYRGVSAAGRRQRTGADSLLIRKTRLTKMYVYIHETG